MNRSISTVALDEIQCLRSGAQLDPVSYSSFSRTERDAACGHDFVVAGSGGDHEPDLAVLAHHKVDHDGAVGDGLGLADGLVDLVLGAHTAARRNPSTPPAAQSRECGARECRRRCWNVNDRDFDRRTLDRTRDQLLVAHPETPVPVDGPNLLVAVAELGVHRRHRDPHRSPAPGLI